MKQIPSNDHICFLNKMFQALLVIEVLKNRKNPWLLFWLEFLSHLVLELFLKSCLIYKSKYFLKTHTLNLLYQELGFNPGNKDFINQLQKAHEYRYKNGMAREDTLFYLNLEIEVINTNMPEDFFLIYKKEQEYFNKIKDVSLQDNYERAWFPAKDK